MPLRSSFARASFQLLPSANLLRRVLALGVCCGLAVTAAAASDLPAMARSGEDFGFPPWTAPDQRSFSVEQLEIHTATGEAAPGFEVKRGDLRLEGVVSAFLGPAGVRMTVNRLRNFRGGGVSGVLRLDLWATATPPVDGDQMFPHVLAATLLGNLSGGAAIQNLDTGFLPYFPPSSGCLYLTVAVLEQVNGRFFYSDFVTLETGGSDDFTGRDRFSFGGVFCPLGSSCVPGTSVACLRGGRFEVSLGWANNSAIDLGTVMAFNGQRAENNESVFFAFANPANFELGAKVLNGCAINNRHWVFLGGLTNQGWKVIVRDTQTGGTRTYINDLGRLTPTVADTSALSCP